MVRRSSGGRVLGGRGRMTRRASMNGGSMFASVTGGRLRACLAALAAFGIGALLTVPGSARASTAAATAGTSARVDPVPIATVNTEAVVGGQAGIEIRRPSDPQPLFYPAPAGTWLEVLVLNRSDLSTVSITSYPCPAAATSHTDSSGLACASQVHNALSNLSPSDLVIAASPRLLGGGQDLGAPIGPRGAGRALGSIGVTSWPFWTGGDNSAIRQGLFSAIGVPGTPAGAATESVASGPDAPTGSGAISGYLLRDNKGLYEFTSPTGFDFSTQAPGSDQAHSVMSVGDRRFQVDIPADSAGGFQVTTVAQRLAGNQTEPAVETRWFGTGSTVPATSRDQVLAMSRYLEGIAAQKSSDPRFVLVASRGNPGVAIPGDNPSMALGIYQAVSTLVTDLTDIGGTRNGGYSVLQGATAGRALTLVGQVGLTTGQGYQRLGSTASHGSGAALSDAVVNGRFGRNGPYYGLSLQTAGPVATQRPLPALLENAVFQAPAPWPEYGNPGRTAAIEWLGTQVYDTNQPRTQYWTIPYSVETWNAKKADLRAQQYPQGQPFSQADFDWAKEELITEIGWLEAEHAFLSSLAQPFAHGALESWAALQSVATDVNTQVGTAPEDKVRQSVLAIFNAALEAGGELPEPAGTVIGIVGTIYHLAAELTSINSAGIEDAAAQFQVRVADLGKEFAARLQDAQDMLMTQYANVIASDYGRLRLVGECAQGHQAGCPNDPALWQFTQEDQRVAANDLQYGALATFYSALVGAKYTVYDLPVSPFGDKTPDRFIGHDLDPFAQVCIFKGDPAYSSTIASVERNSEGFYTTWHVSVLGYTTGQGTISDPWHMHWPDESIMRRMFSPVDPTGDPATGGLGMDPETTFALFPHHAQLPYFPFSAAPAATQWAGNSAGCVPVLAPGASSSAAPNRDARAPVGG